MRVSSQVCSLSAAVEDGLREIQQHGLQATLLSPKPSSWWQEAKLKGPLPFQGLFASQLQCMSCKYKVLHLSNYWTEPYVIFVVKAHKSSFISILYRQLIELT